MYLPIKISTEKESWHDVYIIVEIEHIEIIIHFQSNHYVTSYEVNY